HTRFSRDWSSDVCSSDLARIPVVTHDRRYLLPDYALSACMSGLSSPRHNGQRATIELQHYTMFNGYCKSGGKCPIGIVTVSPSRSEERRVGKGVRVGGTT